MAKAQGVNKKVSFKKETTWGELAGASGGKQVRRVTADFNLQKETYESNEISFHKQNSTSRHGVRSADGSLNAELSPSSYAEFIASVVGRDFATATGSTGVSLTIAASGTNFTLTRAAGSYITDGILVGSVVRLTGAGLNAANVGNNLLVLTVTATILTVQVLSSTSLVAEGPVASVSVTPVGKITFIPGSSHTDDSYTIEEWYSDIAQSAVYTGMKVGSFNVSVPASGVVTSDFSFMGKNLSSKGTTEYFTNPTAVGTTAVFTAVQGSLVVNGGVGACITDMSFNVERAMEAAQCVGSNFASEIFMGKFNVTGNLSAYFSDATLRNAFDDESKVTIILALTTSNAKNADVMTIVIPNARLNSATNSDTELGITQSIDFRALLQDTNTSGLVTSSIMIQDTSLV